MGVEVPAGTAAGHPHRCSEFALQFLVVGVLDVLPDIDASDAATFYGADGVYDVVDLDSIMYTIEVWPRPVSGLSAKEYE